MFYETILTSIGNKQNVSNFMINQKSLFLLFKNGTLCQSIKYCNTSQRNVACALLLEQSMGPKNRVGRG
jgi:hypothetical protein